jgi:hypothetical protein
MRVVVWLSTVTICIAFVLAVIFGVAACIKHNSGSKIYLVNAIMSAVLLVCCIPPVAGSWSFVTRKSTYDIGPGDYIGFWILYFIFVIPVLLAWPCVLCCCMRPGASRQDPGHGEKYAQASVPAAGSDLCTVTVPPNGVPGQQMTVEFPSGPATVVIPAGHAPGSTFQVAAPAVVAVPTMQSPVKDAPVQV